MLVIIMTARELHIGKTMEEGKEHRGTGTLQTLALPKTGISPVAMAFFPRAMAIFGLVRSRHCLLWLWVCFLRQLQTLAMPKQTILLRDRQQQDYCVCCNELETDLAKDDPAVSAKAARSQVEEHEQSASAVTQNGPSTKTVVSGNGQSSGITPPGKRTRQTVSAHRQSHTHKSTGGSEHAHSYQNETHIGRPACPLHLKEHHHHHLSPETMLDLPAGSQDIVPESMAVVMSKMYWATHELKGTASVEGSTQLCLLVKACADAITSLRYLVPGELTD
ncbi:Sjoegren syndrome/scleroderma autoantigen 1 homolog isoform X1 [Acanthaster planci]|uniref:Sjoegren syndrome/scleroderma autoantigen 1 homolog isoform X1 n=1 Tax=Acanthaster planci TaxID=133434 RepID=A0A8B7YKG7_ACAPL|nr:Sjoegren syndrome/scleroderma autoantigen 1 homolog isoform X1 [Acanthaster planci]